MDANELETFLFFLVDADVASDVVAFELDFMWIAESIVVVESRVQ